MSLKQHERDQLLMIVTGGTFKGNLSQNCREDCDVDLLAQVDAEDITYILRMLKRKIERGREEAKEIINTQK